MVIICKEIIKFYGDTNLRSKEVQKALKFANESVEHDIREDLQEVSLGDNMLRKDFPNVWASKDAKLYRVLARLISQDGFVDNMKAYKKNPKDYLNRLRNIAKNPKKYEKSFGPNFSQYINNPKPNQHYAKLPEENIEEGIFGINIHRATKYEGRKSTQIDKWSAGCQVIADNDDWHAFLDICQSAREIWGNSFTYTLLESKDIV